MRNRGLIHLGIVVGILLGLFSNCYAAEDVYFDLGEASKGIVQITYKGSTAKKLKVMIEKADKKYTYNISNQGKTESFPLQLGSGTYKIRVLENISGKSYSVIASQEAEVKLQNENIVYLNSIQNINWNFSSLAVKKAVELTDGTTDLEEKAKLLYSHMVGGYTYDYKKLAALPSDYVPVIDTTFRQKTGICYDFSSLYAAMLRSQGIPSKLIKGYTPNAEGYHAWNEVYDSSQKKWVIIDTTYDLQVIKAKSKIKMIKSSKDYQKVNEY